MTGLKRVPMALGKSHELEWRLAGHVSEDELELPERMRGLGNCQIGCFGAAELSPI